MNDLDPLVASGLDALPIQAAILNDSGVIRYTNRAWQEFGAANDFTGNPDTIGVNYLAVCDESDDPDAATAADGLRCILDGDEATFSFEYPCHSPDEQRWFMMRAAAFDHEGERYVFVFHLNITDRVLAEHAADARADRLEDLAALLSHDLRNPLAVALGYAEMLAADLPDDDRLDRVQRSLDRMEELIDDALVLARREDEVEVEPLELSREVRDAWAQVPTKSATLSVVDDLVFDANASLTAHLFENLFRNAVEHGGEDVAVRVGATADGFYVEDDGPGFASEVRADAFETGVSTAHEGTGLGLAIVAAVAEAHGWSVRATESEAGGARIEVGNVSVADESGSRS
ncbi:sensor histidine kinase [Haloparvum sedimenti]|uniref:sensor histidine kinase n=1 Tax=Haloparvum sedimenti TaxID=1678448 RepID=UPI00071E8EDD|nr:HAMP domain-containing sensor histidine kinase [Haloparvum sedimenti]